jgi:hypothetical protein
VPEVRCSECSTVAREGARFCAACGCELPAAIGSSTGTVIAAPPVMDRAPAMHRSTVCASAAAAPIPGVVAPDARTEATYPSLASADGRLTGGAALQVFPWWQFIIFPIISVGLWSVYWFYCTRKQVNELNGNARTDAGVQTVGAVVPIWQCWVARDIWRDIDLVAKRAGTKGIDSGTYTTLYVVFGYVPIANYFGFILLILFCITQGRFISAIDALSGGRAVRRKLTVWSAVWAFLPLVVAAVLVTLAAVAG